MRLTAAGVATRGRTEIRGDGSAGWIGGVPNQANITMPWRCQPVGTCTAQNVSTCSGPVLEASLQCPDASCNATHVRPCLLSAAGAPAQQCFL